MNKIILPLHIDMPRKTNKDKRYYINLNSYRNWHFIINNKIKKAFKDAISYQLNFKVVKPKFEYQLYYKDKRKRDKMNVISILDKFLLDAMVECECFEDDNDSNTNIVTINNPKIDKLYPRCEVTIC